eukprot:COSAG06_NODE_24783_length_652_cov_2.341772_1_plen_126_part_01
MESRGVRQARLHQPARAPMGAQRKPQRARRAWSGAARRQHAVERSGAKPLGAESARRAQRKPQRAPPGAAQLGSQARSGPQRSTNQPADGAQRKPQRARPAWRGAARRQHAVERSGAKPLGAESAR